MENLPFDELVSFEKLASLQSSYDVNIESSYLPRLEQSCVKVLNPVHANFRFYVDMHGLNTVEGSIKAEVSFICQRCGKEFLKVIESTFESTCDEEKARSLRIEDKLDIVSLEEDGSFNLVSFLEDCLLLEIPYITSHDEDSDECTSNQEEWSFGQVESSETDNPFAALAGLKGQLKK